MPADRDPPAPTPPPGDPPDPPAPPPPPPLSDADYEALLLDPAVEAAVRRTLRRYGVPAQDHDDGWQDVFLRARRRPAEKRPRTLDGVIALCIRIAGGWAIDAYRRRKTEADAGKVDFNEEEAERAEKEDRDYDAVGIAEVVAEIDRTMPDDIRRYQADLDAGLTQKQVAEKHGVKYQHVRDRMRTWRMAARATLIAAGVVAAGWFAVVMFDIDILGPPKVGAPPPPDWQPTQEGPEEPTPGTPEAKARATELREQAKTQCAAEEWKKCLRSYDRASELDAEGETPEVKAAHDRAREEARKLEKR